MIKDYETPVIFFPEVLSIDRLGSPNLDMQRYLCSKIKLNQDKL